MQPIVIFIIITVALVGHFYFGQLLEQEEELPLEQPGEPLPETEESVPTKTQIFSGSVKSAAEPSKSKPTISVDTHIVSGPKEGEVIDETNKVAFEFKAEVFPEETEGQITFETKLEGFDDGWKKTSSSQRTINLPSGPKEYTFLVRAKIKDAIDSTPAKRTFKINTSPYFGKVKISSLSPQTSPRSSLITLSTHLGEEKINITGWQLRGKGGSFSIPEGTEKYLPGYNPEPTENIIVKEGDKIYLSSAQNPLGRNQNFRPNKCLGYLTNYYNFTIPLSKGCPKPEKEEISHLSDCCQKFISDLKQCGVPDYSKKESIRSDSQCTSYLIENFNYAACFRKHYRDEDFLKKEWHIYMGSNSLLNSSCDTIYLRDQNGLFVDKHSYGRPVCN